MKALKIPSSSTSAYCQARQNLDADSLDHILQQTSNSLPSEANINGLHGRRVIVALMARALVCLTRLAIKKFGLNNKIKTPVAAFLKPQRPDRHGTRAVKRRPKPFQLMTKPRHEM